MDIEEAFQMTGRMGRYQVLLTIICYTSNLLNGSQLFLMVMVGATPNKDIPSERNLTTIVTEWDLYNDQWVISLLGSLFLAGFIVGSFVFGQLPDLYGRKPIYVISGTLSCISCFCSAFCQNWHTFALTRFIGGIFAGGSGTPCFVLMCELVSKDIWASVGMLYQLFFSAGIILIGLLGYLFKNWRDVIMVSSGLSAVMLPFFIFMFACALSYYGLAVDISNLMPNIYLGTVLSGAVEMPAYIITLFLLDFKWFGRQGTMTFLILTSSITSTCILFTGGEGQLSVLKTVLGLTSKLSIAAAFCVMFIYVSELFPTQVRAVAMVVGITAARVGAILAFFVPLLGNTAFFLPYAIFGAFTAVGGLLMICFPETLGRGPFLMSDFGSAETPETINGYAQTDELLKADTEKLLT